MPYGDLAAQAVQRYATLEDLDIKYPVEYVTLLASVNASSHEISLKSPEPRGPMRSSGARSVTPVGNTTSARTASPSTQTQRAA